MALEFLAIHFMVVSITNFINYFMKNIILIISLNLFLNCNSVKTNDYLQIEKLLNKYKRYAMLDLYEKSTKNKISFNKLTNNRHYIDYTRIELIHEYCLIIDFYSKNHPTYSDSNYDNLIKKWMSKEYTYNSSVDDTLAIPIMEQKRALDFYESEDLKKYIDSLRNMYHSKYNNKQLISLECIREIK